MKFSSSAVATLIVSAGISASAFLPSAHRSHGGRASTVAFQKHVPQRHFHWGNTPLRMSTEVVESSEQTYEFQAEVGRVMDIIINSLYSDRDIFLRELVSNAADACDKKRFLSITSDHPELVKPEIKIKPNPDDNTLTIEDTGVGMTKDELINNLGRIAQSGTKAFLEALGSGKAEVNLIGQFGVGFYSAYLIADKVEVVTRSMQPGSPQFRWTSSAGSSYTIADDSDNPDQLPSSGGTRLILHLKEDATDYLETSKIDELLQRYSEFIEFPISVWKEKTEYKKVPDEEANKDLKEGDEPKMKTVPETTEGYERANNQKPIWLRPPREVTEDEYKDFYKSAFRASYDDPMEYSHFVMEGQVECKAILYIPGMLPFELSKDMFDENARNIRLYVKRVFINDKFDDLMPRWLKFVRGVVDSDDLPLNVSREILQKSKVLSIINKRLVRKSLDMIREIAESDNAPDDEENENSKKGQYVLFWNNFGKYLKVGVVEDDKNKNEIAPLLRFWSSKSGEEYTSLDKYVENMPAEQKSIYYVTGDGRENTAMSPVIEKLASRGYDVLFATEPLDEIMMESLRSYKDKDIVDAAKDGLKLDENETEEDKKKKEVLQQEYKQVTEYLETLLSGQVQKVVLSDLLTDSPAALVQGTYGMSPTMQRYMRAQAVASGRDGGLGMGDFNKAIMEINPKHPIIQDLDRMVKADREGKEAEEYARLLYDVASMTSGYDVADMSSFAKRVMSMMSGKIQDSVPDAEIVKDSDEGEARTAEVVVEPKFE